MALMSRLERMYLKNNKLTGEIPREFARLEYRTEVDVTGNELTGCVPQNLEGRFGDLPRC